MTKRILTIVMLLLCLAVFSGGCTFTSSIEPRPSTTGK